MDIWTNFFSVVTGQFVVFILAARFQALHLILAFKIIFFSMIIGLPVGFLFDIFIGNNQSIFSYTGMPNTHVFWAANGFLSYGFAIATAGLFPVSLTQHHSKRLRVFGFFTFILTVLLMILLPALSLPLLITMFSWGGLLIICFEGLAAMAGRIAPGMALAMRQFRPFFILWKNSIVIGIIYEGLNWIFPLWHWQLVNGINDWNIEILIISMGYGILFHPMLILFRLMINNIRTTEAD